MNRSAKGFRLFSGIFVLLNLVAAFLPVTVGKQENYPTQTWSTFDYVRSMFGKALPYGDAEISGITSSQVMFIVGLMIVPLLLAVLAGIWAIVGSARQIVSSLLAFVILAVYAGMFLKVTCLLPVVETGIAYERGIGCILYLVFSGIASAGAVAALILTPRKAKTRATEIPKVNEIKQEQIQAKYNLILDESEERGQQTAQSQQASQQQTVQAQQQRAAGGSRGVMVGLTGIYAGAEIPFTSGEYIKIGRLANNDLVFEGQPKVSRNHCRIKWESATGRYSFYDYSSNGTFVNGSEDCLPQNLEIEMMPGTVIAIGDENNTFRLE